MTPVFQTRFGDPEGNCLMACVASLLDVPLDTCPDLYDAEQAGENWWPVLERFVRSHHQQVIYVDPPYLGGRVPAGYSLAAGPGPRGFRHCVVVKDGVLAHDPHPKGGGVEIDGYIVFVPLVAE